MAETADRRQLPLPNCIVKFGGSINLVSLELVLALALGGLDSLHEAEARGLDSSDGIVLLLHAIFVLLLEALNELLEVILGLGVLGLLLLDRGVEVVVGHVLELLDLGLLVIVAEVDVGRAAHRLEVLVGELLQAVKVAATLVVLQGGRVTPLDGRKALNTVGVAERLA